MAWPLLADAVLFIGRSRMNRVISTPGEKTQTNVYLSFTNAMSWGFKMPSAVILSPKNNIHILYVVNATASYIYNIPHPLKSINNKLYPKCWWLYHFQTFCNTWIVCICWRTVAHFCITCERMENGRKEAYHGEVLETCPQNYSKMHHLWQKKHHTAAATQETPLNSKKPNGCPNIQLSCPTCCPTQDTTGEFWERQRISRYR